MELLKLKNQKNNIKIFEVINITKFNRIINDWTRIKNHCRTTVGKEFTEKEPTEKFKRQILISEHSPIRMLEFDWSWKGIAYWVSTEWSRHKFEKFITSQRDDRVNNDVPRKDKPQGALVDFDGYANEQNLIDAWRKRLCYQATDDARKLAEDYKIELHDYEPEASDVLVPNCIYRCGCPEFKECGYWANFCKKYKGEDLFNIQNRYDLYNRDFYEGKGGLINSKL